MYPTLPIVIASGYAESDVRATLKDDGPIAFLAKPYTQERLLAMLRSLITKPSAELKV
jgi:CheY-like chemotaxis protein